MPFPLTGSLLEGDLYVVPLYDGGVVGFAAPVVSWSLRHTQHLFPPSERSGPVVKRGTEGVAQTKTKVAVRRWNGVGGIQYVPSFPQLDLKETSFPLGR